MESESREERIARKIVGFVPTLHVINDQTGQMEEIEVDEVIIVMSDEPVTSNMARYAADGGRPSKYSLEEVRQLLELGRKEFKRRADGKSNPRNINIDENEAIDIIKSLTYDDNFDKTLPPFGEDPAADVYKKFGYTRALDGEQIDLYIKFGLVQKRNVKKVFIISFHLEGDA